MTSPSTVKWTALLLAAGLLAGCATGPRQGLEKTDPIEPFNRVMLQGNKTLDRVILRPTSHAYDFVTPTTIKFIIRNELDYLNTPVDFFNYLFQGDIDRSLSTLGRFTINTVLGGLGFLDPATEFGLPAQDTDFGITLGRWGVDEGPYLVLPFLGPSTVRDVFGTVVDTGFYPLTYVGPFTTLDGLSPAVRGVELVDTRAKNGDLIDQLLYESEDPYVTLRAAYLQRRRAQVAGEKGEIENLPDIFEDEASQQGTSGQGAGQDTSQQGTSGQGASGQSATGQGESGQSSQAASNP